jgi:hypothetical protein
MTNYTDFFKSIIEEIFKQEKLHFHKLIEFSNLKTNETFKILNIKYEPVDISLEDNIKIIIHDDKYNKINYNNQKNVNYFKDSIKHFLLKNNYFLRELDSEIPKLTDKNLNMYKIIVKLIKFEEDSRKITQYAENIDHEKYDINPEYKNKYIKYKNKYLLLKNQVGGWQCLCGMNVDNNLICCTICQNINIENLLIRLRDFNPSPGFLDDVQQVFSKNSNKDIIVKSDQQIVKNILTLPGVRFDWFHIYDEPKIKYMEFLLFYIYIKNWEHENSSTLSIGTFLDMIKLLYTLFIKNCENLPTFHTILHKVLSEPQLNQFIGIFSTPIEIVIECKNNNKYFNNIGGNIDYVSECISMYPSSVQYKAFLSKPFDITKFQNNTWRNEILLSHIFNFYELHNGMGWGTLNLLDNLARKLGYNIWNYRILQYIHSYLHTLDTLNFDEPRNQFSLIDITDCRNMIKNQDATIKIEQALNFNCSHFLLKNIHNEYYFNPYYLKKSFIKLKRDHYKHCPEHIYNEVIPIPTGAQTTQKSFCDDRIPLP